MPRLRAGDAAVPIPTRGLDEPSLLRRRYQIGTVIEGGIDQAGNLVCLHGVGGIGSKKADKGGSILHLVVQPERLQVSGEDDRHPVVDGLKDLVGLCRDDGA